MYEFIEKKLSHVGLLLIGESNFFFLQSQNKLAGQVKVTSCKNVKKLKVCFPHLKKPGPVVKISARGHRMTGAGNTN